MENNSVMIDPKALVEFFEAHEGRWDSYDISTADELKDFLTDFCAHGMGAKGGEAVEKTDPETGKTPFDVQNIYFKSKRDAELMLLRMGKAIERDGYITALGYYRLANSAEVHIGSNAFGWRSLSGAFVYRYYEYNRGDVKYGIRLPEPVRLWD